MTKKERSIKGWKRAMASAIVMLLAVMGAALLGAVPANAHGTPPPSQTVTCEFIKADYHRPLRSGDHINVTINGRQPVNAYVDLNVEGGWSGFGLRINGFEPIPLNEAEIQSGVITLDYAARLKTLGWEKPWTIEFVQTNETDTWPNLKCEDPPPPPPPPGVAKAGVTTTPATCSANGSATSWTENATLVGTLDQSVGNHSAVFRAATDTLFALGDTNGVVSDNRKELTVEYEIGGKLPSQSDDPSAPCYVAPPPPPPTPTPTPTATPAPPSKELAGTGTDGQPLLIGAVLAVVAILLGGGAAAAAYVQGAAAAPRRREE